MEFQFLYNLKATINNYHVQEQLQDLQESCTKTGIFTGMFFACMVPCKIFKLHKHFQIIYVSISVCKACALHCTNLLAIMLAFRYKCKIE